MLSLVGWYWPLEIGSKQPRHHQQRDRQFSSRISNQQAVQVCADYSFMHYCFPILLVIICLLYTRYMGTTFIIKQFQNTIRVPNRLTQQRMISAIVPLSRRQIFQLKTRMNNPTIPQFSAPICPTKSPTFASRDCVNLSGPALAQCHPNSPCVSLWRHCVNL